MTFSPLASPSRTKAVLDAHGVRLSKRLGQHFLVDDHVVGRTLALAGLGPSDVVLEVGPGIGTLTVALCEAARAVVAVERDARLLAALDEVARDCPGLHVVHGDALRIAVERLTGPAGPPGAMVANLPYEVAARVVLRLFEEMPGLGSATVMVQSEVADRMSAPPGGKEYSAYTVKLALRARMSDRFPVSRNCFLPPPRVDSAVVRLDRVDRGETAAALDAAARVATAAFRTRRKTLRNSLAAAVPGGRDAIEPSLVAADVDGGRRAETLGVDEYLALGAAMRENGVLP